MTDKEIIKALEVCTSEMQNCEICPLLGNCDPLFLDSRALDLISRQQTEIERFKIEKEELIKAYREIQVSNLMAFVKSLCKDRVSNDPVVIAAQVELKEWLGDTE